MVHPKFPGWVKVGSTTNPTRRLGSYNTGDPNRAYRMLTPVWTSDRRAAEWLAHRRLSRLGYDKQGEWFEVSPTLAQRIALKAVADAEEECLFR